MVCNHLQIKKLKLNCWNLRTRCNSTQCNSFFKKRQYLWQKHSRNQRSCLKWEYTRTRSYIFGEYTNKFSESICHMLWKWKRELRSVIVPCRIRFESVSAFSDFIERDEGWQWGLRSEMKGKGEGWDRRWRVRVTAWDRRDGGWRWRSEMEREARVEIGEMESDGWDRRWRVRRGFLIRDGGWGEGFWSEMDGEGDGFRSERWRVREKMDGDRALQRVIGFKMCLRKKKKKKRRDCPKKVKDKRPMAACIKRGRSSIQKKRGYSCKKHSFRRGLRPRI